MAEKGQPTRQADCWPPDRPPTGRRGPPLAARLTSSLNWSEILKLRGVAYITRAFLARKPEEQSPGCTRIDSFNRLRDIIPFSTSLGYSRLCNDVNCPETPYYPVSFGAMVEWVSL